MREGGWKGGGEGKERVKEGDREEEVQEVGGKRRAPLEESRTTARARLRVGLITKHN